MIGIHQPKQLQPRFGEQGIAIGIILVIEIQQGGLQAGAQLDRHLLAKGSGGHIADHHFNWNHPHRTHEHPAGVPHAQIVGGNPTGGEVLKQSSRDLAVELPLARQFGLFEGVEGRGVILELNRHQVGAIGGIDPLGLAFV